MVKGLTLPMASRIDRLTGAGSADDGVDEHKREDGAGGGHGVVEPEPEDERAGEIGGNGHR